MINHSAFWRGFIIGVAFIGAVDLTFVHIIFKYHRIYPHPSVNYIEPILVLITIIIGYIVYKKEYNKS